MLSHATCKGSSLNLRREMHLKKKNFFSYYAFLEDRFNGKHMDSSLLKINLTSDDNLFTFQKKVFMQKNYTLGVLIAVLQSCNGKWDPALKAVNTGVVSAAG